MSTCICHFAASPYFKKESAFYDLLAQKPPRNGPKRWSLLCKTQVLKLMQTVRQYVIAHRTTRMLHAIAVKRKDIANHCLELALIPKNDDNSGRALGSIQLGTITLHQTHGLDLLDSGATNHAHNSRMPLPATFLWYKRPLQLRASGLFLMDEEILAIILLAQT